MDGPFIMPVVDKYKDMGTVVMGKVEAGTTRKTSTLLLMPNRVRNLICLYAANFVYLCISPKDSRVASAHSMDDDSYDWNA